MTVGAAAAGAVPAEADLVLADERGGYLDVAEPVGEPAGTAHLGDVEDVAGVEGVGLVAAALVAEDDGAGGGGGDGPVDGDEDGGVAGGVLAEVDEIVAEGVGGVAGGCEGAVGFERA